MCFVLFCVCCRCSLSPETRKQPTAVTHYLPERRCKLYMPSVPRRFIVQTTAGYDRQCPADNGNMPRSFACFCFVDVDLVTFDPYHPGLPRGNSKICFNCRLFLNVVYNFSITLLYQ